MDPHVNVEKIDFQEFFNRIGRGQSVERQTPKTAPAARLRQPLKNTGQPCENGAY